MAQSIRRESQSIARQRGIGKPLALEKSSSLPADTSSANIAERRYREINKSLRWAALENLRIHWIHVCITQEEIKA
jgi:hypothetical protein